MRTPLGTTILVSMMILLDFYVFSALEAVSIYAASQTQTIIYSVYWTVATLTIAGLVLFVFTDAHFMSKKIRAYLFATILAFFFAQIVASVFFLADDARRIVQWIFQKAFAQKALSASATIPRSQLLSWAGLAAGTTLFGSLVLGFTNKYNYRVKRIKLTFKNLPDAFNGFKLVHFSDVHSGSFMNKKAVEEGVQKILDQKADLIIFSGDLVNDRATEMENYMDVFSKIKAPMGVYSTLGNHDYGDYVKWPYQGVSRQENLAHLKQVHKQLGWRLMMNEHQTIKKGNDEIALIGIENWSPKARFPKHGDMKKAYAGTESFSFKILISHDPSHWETEVVTQYPDVNLTLSGHTHGMQFGIEIGSFKWSPVQYIYKKWKGLYEHGSQKLYINPGFGFIGYPGRVGIMPEITVIELVKA